MKVQFYIFAKNKYTMETLVRNYTRLVDSTPVKYRRYLYDEIDWQDRLIGITEPAEQGKRPSCCNILK